MSNMLGADPATLAVESYETPDEYGGQGNTRVIRALRFLYKVGIEDSAGNVTVEAREALQGEEVTIEQIGMEAQMQGERDHAFYTDDEREKVEAGMSPDSPGSPSASTGEVSSLGEFELSEYIKGANPSGKELTVNETVELAGGDKDLAHRLLQAENIATDGEPRKGVEAGLTAIIES